MTLPSFKSPQNCLIPAPPGCMDRHSFVMYSSMAGKYGRIFLLTGLISFGFMRVLRDSFFLSFLFFVFLSFRERSSPPSESIMLCISGEGDGIILTDLTVPLVVFHNCIESFMRATSPAIDLTISGSSFFFGEGPPSIRNARSFRSRFIPAPSGNLDSHSFVTYFSTAGKYSRILFGTRSISFGFRRVLWLFDSSFFITSSFFSSMILSSCSLYCSRLSSSQKASANSKSTYSISLSFRQASGSGFPNLVDPPLANLAMNRTDAAACVMLC
mmetsp:Transcript_12772/g.22995  ORF Transcript_12772/g.22995 Transcript_12772/m.22995 type:complete len:271 (+) Transcript_12772:510-1322(+)